MAEIRWPLYENNASLFLALTLLMDFSEILTCAAQTIADINDYSHLWMENLPKDTLSGYY